MDDFERFLNWLNPDPEQAAAEYEKIRRKLIRFFLCRGWEAEAEELSDETITRVIKRIQELADSYVGDRLPYFLGVARNVHYEQLKIRKRRKKIIDIPPPPPPDWSEEEEKERLDFCLHRCMKELSEENRKLILRYYIGEKHEKIVERKKLADELRIAPNALRIRAHRIRTDLRRCVENCLAEENQESDDETNHRNHH